MDLCEPEMKEKILELQKLSAADLDKQIKEKEAEIEKAEKTFTDEVDKLQKAYQKLQEDKEATVTAVKECAPPLTQGGGRKKGIILSQNMQETSCLWHQQGDLVELCFKHLWAEENFLRTAENEP